MIRWGGISFSFHPLFVLVMLTSVFTGHFLELLALFAIVFVHELGHVAAARLFGLSVVSVQLLPFGGVAVIEEHGDLSSSREIVIALAGPLQNLLLIMISTTFHVMGLWDGAFFFYFIQCNLLIALFNLLPILPLDGGKLVQAVCAMCLPYHTTLVWTLRISLVFSSLMVLYAMMPLLLGKGGPQLNLLMIGGFLLYSNYTDYRNIPYRFLRFLMGREAAFTRHLLQGSLAYPIIAEHSKPLDQILRLLRREKYHFVYIMNSRGKIFSVIPEQRIISSYLRGDPGG
ncbi:stage IV sporulation protein FB [Paenibacillus antibioticophila]|uniref:Stage IV sporulation protein FB n=1 Tax=Paenibacillus antibioticophila TaxID=1274374 RepID=A0A920CJW3_9BACL|nr:M50 family metallopeptidase [Paenibacillus antibioticophila]GIO39879.1 stage IV sporulation protein FB [Paenibacillus antibioticophila]